jgi:DNA-binding transcriptional LysR family regulator
MKFSTLLTLQDLYKSRNITKTAHNLGLSQPALTKRLKQIEAEYGITLVKRERRGISFTTEGEFLAGRAQYLLKKQQEIREIGWSMRSEPTGTIKVGISNFFTKFLFLDVLREFQSLYPNIQFQIETGWSRNIFNLLVKEELHVAFVRGDYSWAGLRQLLFEENMVIASSEPIEIEALPNLPMISYKTDIKLKSMMEKWWYENFTVPPQVIMEVDRSDTCLDMISNNLGFSILPGLVARNAGEINTTPIYDKAGERITRKSWMFSKSERQEQYAALRIFTNYVQHYVTNQAIGK